MLEKVDSFQAINCTGTDDQNQNNHKASYTASGANTELQKLIDNLWIPVTETNEYQKYTIKADWSCFQCPDSIDWVCERACKHIPPPIIYVKDS